MEQVIFIHMLPYTASFYHQNFRLHITLVAYFRRLKTMNIISVDECCNGEYHHSAMPSIRRESSASRPKTLILLFKNL